MWCCNQRFKRRIGNATARHFKMNAFLRQSRQTALALAESCAKATGKVEGAHHFVLGNESCDLDSAMSTIAFAWFMTKLRGIRSTTHYTPVLNINRTMFRLRTETNYLLGKFGVGQNDLVFRDDLNFQDLVKHVHIPLQFTLVDHHLLAKQDEFLEPFILEVIDHRQQMATFAPSVKVEIETTGSCVTLVAERIRKAMAQEVLLLNKEEEMELKYMIAGPIVLDTVNLKQSAGKVTPRDEKIVEIFWGPDRNELTGFYEELSRAKYSAEGLTAKDLMLKDPKFIESGNGETKVMFSTLHDSLKNFLEREDASNTVPDLLASKNCQLWVALAPQTNDEAGKPYKPVILFSTFDEMRNKVQEALVASQSPSLEMVDSQAPSLGTHYSFLKMCNVKASRKQVLPIVLHFITSELLTTRIERDL